MQSVQSIASSTPAALPSTGPGRHHHLQRARRAGPLPDHSPQRRRRPLRAEQDRRRDDEGLPGRARHAGRRVGQRARNRRRPHAGRHPRMVRSRPGGGTFHIEDVQDQVELGLMRGGHHDIARAYVLYRDRRAQERAKQGQETAGSAGAARDRRRPPRPLDMGHLHSLIEFACAGLSPTSSPSPSSPRRCATCTTACRSTRSTRRPSWPPAR
jgi:hypothetical protein